MKTFEITYEKNGIYHSNLAKASSVESVSKWYETNKPDARVIAIEEATSDSMKPGKPCLTIEDVEAQPTETTTKTYTTYTEYSNDLDKMLDQGWETVANYYDNDNNLIVTYERED